MGAVKNFYHDEICGREPDDEPDVEVCSNCGAYFDGRYPSKWQRCGPCRVGLEPAASGIETEGEDPAEGLRAEHESPTAATSGGDAHTPPEGSVQQTRGGDR